MKRNEGNHESSQALSDKDSKGDLAIELIEKEAGESQHSDATKLSGVGTGDLDDNTTPGSPKAFLTIDN